MTYDEEIIGVYTLEVIYHAPVSAGGISTLSTFAVAYRRLITSLQPIPWPSQCMDRRIREVVEAKGCLFKFLPPYSPDYNPIELSFSVLEGLNEVPLLTIVSFFRGRL